MKKKQEKKKKKNKERGRQSVQKQEKRSAEETVRSYSIVHLSLFFSLSLFRGVQRTTAPVKQEIKREELCGMRGQGFATIVKR